VRGQLQTALAQKCAVEIQQETTQLKNRYIENRQVEVQKVYKLLAEEIKDSSLRVASRRLARVMARYEPTFLWPKAVNHIELTPKDAELLTSQEDLIAELREVSGVEIE